MASTADDMLSVFDHVYVINLPHRQDRRRDMAAELGRLGLGFDHPAVTLFPAVFPADQGPFSSRGARGCFESHLGVHRRILADDVPRALILEDDAGFGPEFAPRFAALAPELKGLDWDVLYSVAPITLEDGDEELGRGMIRLAPEHGFPTTHFMGVSRGFSERAVPYLQAMLGRLPGRLTAGPCMWTAPIAGCGGTTPIWSRLRP